LTQNSAFLKRIKRQVVARSHRFFAATSPGLNRLCADELSGLVLTTLSDIETGAGGVGFRGWLSDLYEANLKLRTANRILMRLYDFKAANFRQLEKKILDFPWELYLFPDQPVQLSVTAARCRLYHKEAIVNTVLPAIGRRLTTAIDNGQAKTCHPVQRIFVRGSDDRWVLSLDSSGDNLYKRGIKIHGGSAPIRETLAAAALRIAGYAGQVPLVDPMCGSGTFSIEAAMTAANIPAGWFREFGFMDWPSFQPGQWRHIRKKAEDEIVRRTEPLIFASDIDETALTALESTVQSHGLSGLIHVCRKDFFKWRPSDENMEKGLVVLNPPYGIRMETRKSGDRLFSDIIRKLADDYRGWSFILIAPERRLLTIVPFPYSVYPIFHGGLEVGLVVGRI
jgi:putative N6-adenine-specific DNA methylase